ncbi:MAG: MFS transporter [Chloroflexi bacterium]|nr:MFS transporter [Chloroflexota bacterium]
MTTVARIPARVGPSLPEVRPSRQVFSRAIVGITALNFVFFSGYLLFFPTLPFFIEKLGGSESEIGLLIAVSSLTAMLVRPLVGYLVDRVGHRPLLIAGLAAFGVTALLYNLALVPVALMPLRVLTGASLATVVTAATAYVADAAPPLRRSEVIGYYGMANSLAFAVGPAIGGFIIRADWLNGTDGTLVSWAPWSSGARTGDLHFATLFAVAAAITLVATVIAIALPPGRSVHPGARAGGTAFAAGRAALFGAGINASGSFSFAALVAFIPLFARDQGVSNPGLLFVAYAIALIACRLLLGRRLEGAPRELVVAIGLAFVALAMGLVGSVAAPPALVLASAIFGLGAGLYQPALMAYVIDRIDPATRGRAMGTFTLGADFGISSGSFLLGVVTEAAGYAAAFWAAALVTTAGAATMAAWWTRPGHAASGPAGSQADDAAGLAPARLTGQR